MTKYDKECECCTGETDKLYDNEGSMVCIGCLDSEIERLQRLRGD